MLNEGTSIQAGFSVSVGLMEGMHESPIQSPYGLKTLLCVTGAIVQSPFACQNMYYTCWNGDTEPFAFLEMLNVLLHVQPWSWNPGPLLKGSLPYRNLAYASLQSKENFVRRSGLLRCLFKMLHLELKFQKFCELAEGEVRTMSTEYLAVEKHPGIFCFI